MIEYYNGEEVIEFVSKCPVDGCNNDKEIHWRHSGCDEKEYINSEGIIICTVCGHRIGFYDYTFRCQIHQNYKPPSRDSQRLIAAFAMIGRFSRGPRKKFIRKLLNNLIDQCDDD